jgi:hypothetical protein
MTSRISIRPIRLPVAGLLALCAGAASACDSCSCHAPPELGEGRSGFSVALFEQYTDFSTLQEAGREIGNPTGQWLRSSTTQAIATYRIDSVFAVSAFVPYISRSFKRPNEGVDERGTVEGLGDISVVGSARVFHHQGEDSAFNATVLAGIKTPTGDPIQLKSERDGGGDEDPDNAVGGHDLQLGTGSWDVVAGVNAIGRVERWYAAAQVFCTYHTEGAYQYRVANELTATGSLGCYLVMEPRDRLGVQVNVIGETKGQDRVAGEYTTDTANHNLFVGPEVDVLWHGSLSGVLALDLPVNESNSDVQLVPTWRLRAALGWRF